MARQTSAEIDEEAAGWAARLDRAPLSAAEDEALDAWLAQDERRAGAFAKARAVALHSERAQALGPDFDPGRFAAAPPPPPGPPLHPDRRRLVLGGGAVAAGIAAVALFGVRLAGERFSTRKGEMRVVPLADGSVMTLNTASVVRVAFSRDRRDVTLVRGEVLFDVAKDPARPFVVAAGDTRVRAVGTSFTVRRLTHAPAQVLVREGVVEVRRTDAPAPTPVRVAANMRLAPRSAGDPLVATPVAATEVSRQLSWREGRLAFEGETLAEAAADFARYSDTALVIDDPAVANEEITGLFQANDPVGFAQGVATALDLKVQVGEGQVRLYR